MPYERRACYKICLGCGRTECANKVIRLEPQRAAVCRAQGTLPLAAARPCAGRAVLRRHE